MEWSSQIRFHVGQPLAWSLPIIHGLVVLPERAADAAVVDQDINAIVEEFGSFCRCLSYLLDASEITQCPSQFFVLGICGQVMVGGVFKLLFVEVQDKYSVTSLQEMTSQAPADALSSFVVLIPAEEMVRMSSPPDIRMCLCGGPVTEGVEAWKASDVVEVMSEVTP